MAKRFTDTEKWAKPDFHKFSNLEKLIWLYICDNCDHAGVWDINTPLLSFLLNEQITLDQIIKSFGDKISIRDDKLILTGFITFQYGQLNPENKVHKSVISRLEKLAPCKPLGSPSQGAKDKDKAKNKNKENDLFNFEILYQSYPLKKGRIEGITRLKKFITSQADFDSFQKAINNYTRNIQASGTDPKYIKHFSSFVGTEKLQPWKDWLDDDAGSAIAVTPKPLFNKATQRTENNRAAAEAYLKKLEGEKV